MTPNGTHDKALLEEIERLLEARKQKQTDLSASSDSAASHPVLDELLELVPQATSEFENALENQLLAKLHRMNHPFVNNDLEEHTPMTANTTLRNYEDHASKRAPYHLRRLPLTLAAAIIAALFGVALLLTLANLPDDEPMLSSALLTATTSPANPDQCPPVDGWTGTYRVRRGDTIAYIAAQYGIDFDHLYEFLNANCLDDADSIRFGDVLRVPDFIPTRIPPTGDTPTPSSGQLEATLTITAATQNANGTSTPTPVSDDAPYVIGGSGATQTAAVEQTAVNSCDTQATLVAQCDESGIAELVETAVQATLSAMEPFIGYNATVNTSVRVQVFEGPGTEFTVLSFLAPNSGIYIVGQSADGAWFEVALSDGRRGWVVANLVTLQPTPVPTLTNTPTPTLTFTPTPAAQSGMNNADPTLNAVQQTLWDCVPRQDWEFERTVITGQTYESIASEYGISVYELLASNCISVDAPIRYGQTLHVPETQHRGTPLTTTQLTQIASTETAQIVVAVQSIQRGGVIEEEDIALRNWLPDAMPVGAFTAIEDVVGMRARTDIYTEQPVLTSMVIEDYADLVSGLDVPAGQRAVAIPFDTIASVSYGVQPGDHVSISIITDDSTNVVVENATVLPIADDMVVVAVSPSEAVVLTSLVESGVALNLFLIPVAESTETTQIVVALRDIERGARIIRADLEMADVPINEIPEDAFTDFDSIIGHRARVDFEVGEPLSEALLVPTLNVDSEYEFDFADNAEIIEIPMAQVDMPGTGQFRNVIVEAELPDGRILTVSHHAYVGYAGLEIEPEASYGIAVPTEDADLLQGLVNAGFPIRLYGFSVEGDDSEFAGNIPAGMRAVAVPMPAVLMDPPLEVGDRVDVLVAIYFVDVDEEFQSIVPTQANVSQGEGLPRLWTVQQPTTDDGETPRLTIQRTIVNAFVVGIGDFPPAEGEDPQIAANIVNIAVSEQDAVILNYLIEANIPLAFVRSAG